MAEIVKSGNIDLLSGKVAVVGYGSQGHAHALNLNDSGVEVVVGLREGSPSWAAAEEAGLTVRTVPEAVKGAQGAAIGAARAGMVETSFAEETETDLFGEQTVLCGGVTQLIQLGFETLVEAGYQPEVAYYECLHELKLIVDLIWEGGIERMHYSISDTAEYGSHAVGPKVVDEHVRENMRTVLRRIRDGAFAQEWIAEMERGQPSLEEYRRKLAEKQIETVGARLRALNVKEETAGVG